MKADVNWKFHEHDEGHKSPKMPSVGCCSRRSIRHLKFLSLGAFGQPRCQPSSKAVGDCYL